MVLAMSPPTGMVSATSGRDDGACPRAGGGPCAAFMIVAPITDTAVAKALFIAALW